MKNSKYTIFLPVRNGGRYFQQCVESILAQSYGNFNLVVLENYSIDQSVEWLKSLRDPRISLLPAKSDLTIQANWGRILNLPKNEYMTIIGHDDLLDSNYLKIMDDLIRKYPDASLYQTHFRLIDAKGRAIRSCLPMPKRETEAQFLISRLMFKRDSFGTGYMMRSKLYEKVGGIPLYDRLLFADDVLWLMLMHNSWKVTAQEECFAYRVHIGSTSFSPDWSSQINSLHQYIAFLDKLVKEDNLIAKVFEQRFPYFLSRFYRIIYFSMILSACENNKIISPDIKAKIVDSMAITAPSVLSKFKLSKIVYILELVNRSIFRKQAYNIWQLYKTIRNRYRLLTG
jgi:glycosyltransferase involved in cell wall biosynthesis